MSQKEIVQYLINTNNTLEATYECYQNIINSLKNNLNRIKNNSNKSKQKHLSKNETSIKTV